jgi:hypothetical protein
MYEIFQKILIIIFILGILYLIFKLFYSEYNLSNTKCNLEKFDIDDLVVIKRSPEYSKYINNLIDKKSFILNDQQIKVLKNPQQIFNVSNDQTNIKNISDIVYTNCNKELEFFNNNNDNSHNNDNIYYYNNDNIEISDNQYENIKNKLKKDIENITEPNCTNVSILQDNIPFSKNYLKNYYNDLYGNKVESNLSDYFVAYYTLINNNNNIGLPINTKIGHSNFIIPDQYNYDSKFTNAYNIDWSRIINPIGYSM